MRTAEKYRHGHDRPLGGYVALMGVYTAGIGAATVLGRALGRKAPEHVSVWDVVQLAIATHRLSRTIAKDPVTSPLRAPFTRYEGTSAAAELKEEVRGDGLQHSVGELITCPMCLAQWVSTAFVGGLVLAPRSTRLAMATMSGVAGADFLQYVYASLQKHVEG
jgi:hypothetical protein